MKIKSILTLLSVAPMMAISGQNSYIELTFTAENSGQYVPLDSIYIENLTQEQDTTLYAPDTVLICDINPGMYENNLHNTNSFLVSQNYPNPFSGKTTIELFLPGKEDIKITVRDILGRELAHYENALKRGNHTFSFYSGNEKYYLLTVIGRQTSQTIKMLNANYKITYGTKDKIIYNGYEDNVIGYKSQKANNKFVFYTGDELKYTAYTDVEETEIFDSPPGNKTYTFQFDGWTPCPGISTGTDIDGNTFNTVQIGSQCWMKENLKTTTYQDGTPIPNVTDGSSWSNLTTGAYVWYDNDISWKGPYGAMYNWYATVDTNGLCPTGWHVPTHIEWTALTNFIGGVGPPHGNELKSCRQVSSPFGGGCNTTEHPRWDDSAQNGTDDYGFSGLPNGNRSYDDGTFSSLGGFCNWWTSTEATSYRAWMRDLAHFGGNILSANHEKEYGFSVRCLKD